MAVTSGRLAKTELLASLLGRAETGELAVLVAWLSGQPRQRRTGLGWASVRSLPPAAQQATLDVARVDAVLQQAADSAGPGSVSSRRDLVLGLLAAATDAEQRFLRALISGEVRQGAQVGVLVEAVARASRVGAAEVRRAMTFAGDLAEVAVALRRGGSAALGSFGLVLGRPIAPMLAQAAPDLATALERTGPAAVEWKLDGVRIQVHRDGDDVAVFTRTLDEIGARLPEVVETVRALPARRLVLDGEAIALRPNGRPQPFQITAARAARQFHRSRPGAAEQIRLSTLFFDALHVDGTDLLDEPGARRSELLGELAPPHLLVPRHVIDTSDTDDDTTDDSGAARAGGAHAFAERALAAGHEGVVVKALAAPYAMGRRGAAWVKVKPRITLDLVVLAVERGHGRRSGWLSNLHLGARDPRGEYGPPGGFVMLGKTFKGLTDAMLTWQTEQLQRVAVSDDGHVVTVRPELVVEIAFDGVQTSPRYPAGMALRFARVLAHRPDKPAGQADTLDAVRAHHDPTAP